ncbi:hypothetical protein BC941DRAFT_465060 [Chlamydoabsidia padenii]|nr:hypothetical protein BC941DRAFT_465060 [Chlamydoabsidia padenii]
MFYSNTIPVDTYYYDILNIPSDANYIVIKKAFKKYIFNKAPDAEEKFKAIYEAFHVLSSVELKAKYDKYGLHQDHGPPGDFSNPSACFQNMYGGEGVFEDIIGDIQVELFFNQDDYYYTKGRSPPRQTEEEGRQRVMEHAEKLQQERTERLASLLKHKLSTSKQSMQQEITRLKQGPDGVALLAVVGRVYTIKTREYLGFKQGGLPDQ